MDKEKAKAVQIELQRLGFYKGAIDGILGDQSETAVKAYQKSKGLFADGIVGSRTLASLFPTVTPVVVTTTTVKTSPENPLTTQFDAGSRKNLANVHPDLQGVLIEARKEIEFRVLDSTRGRKAQEEAFRKGNSKARFGQSAHNYVPAIATDLFPAPYDWNNLPAFDKLSVIVLRIAKARGVPLRWGGDWNMDGDKTKSDAWDKPHFELHPWRTYANKAKLFEG